MCNESSGMPSSDEYDDDDYTMWFVSYAINFLGKHFLFKPLRIWHDSVEIGLELRNRAVTMKQSTEEEKKKKLKIQRA